MHIPRGLFVLAGAIALTFANPAAADLGAGGTRVQINGGVRPHMVFGHADEPEIYAGIMDRVRSLGVGFERRGDEFLVTLKGEPVDRPWPIIRSKDEVPETAEEACILEIGGRFFVPMKRLAEVTGLKFDWNSKQNLVTLLPGAGLPRRAVQVTEGVPQQKPARLTGISLSMKNGMPVLTVRSADPVVPRWFTLKGPDRLVIDFDAAEWQAALELPQGAGDILALRTGSPSPGVARLVLDLKSAGVRLREIEVDEDRVTASLGHGPEVRSVAFAGSKRNKILDAVRRRAGAGQQMASRRGPAAALVQPAIPGDVTPAHSGSAIQVLSPVAGRLEGRTIVVDAGHGGLSSGAKGRNHLEKTLCLQMALAVRDALQSRGARVLLTRSSDQGVTLEARSTFANHSGADIFISIHCNSTLPHRAGMINGTETYWYRNPESRVLAEHVHPWVVGAVQARDGGVRGNRSFHVIREVKIPSVLLEIGYINHQRDEELLSDRGFQIKLGLHVANGVVSYFNQR